MATGDQDQSGKGGGDEGGAGKDVNLNIKVSSNKDDVDHSKVDTSKLTSEELRDFNDKLKDENARRRIANKKSVEEGDKLRASHAEMKKALDDLQGKADADEKAKKEASLAEKSEIEQLQIRMVDMEKAINTKDTEITALRSETQVKEVEIQKKSRENMVDRLVRSLEFQFSSDYERSGFIGDLLKTNTDGGFEKSDEEVILEVNQLAKSRGKELKTPAAGPRGKMTDTPLSQEVQQLLAKPNLTQEERLRLDAIIIEIEKANQK